MDKSTREALATATRPEATGDDKARAFDLLMESKAPPASDDGVSANFERDAVAALHRGKDRDDAREVLHIALTRLQMVGDSPALEYLADRVELLLARENEHPETFATFCGSRRREMRGLSAQHDPDGLAAVDLLLRRYHLPPGHGAKKRAEDWLSKQLGPTRRTIQSARRSNNLLENILEPEPLSGLNDAAHLAAYLQERGDFTGAMTSRERNIDTLLSRSGPYVSQVIRALRSPK